MKIRDSIGSQIKFTIGVVLIAVSLAFGISLFVIEYKRYRSGLEKRRSIVENVVKKHESLIRELYWAGRKEELVLVMRRIASDQFISGVLIFNADGGLIAQHPKDIDNLDHLNSALLMNPNQAHVKSETLQNSAMFARRILSETGEETFLCALYSFDGLKKDFIITTLFLISIFLGLMGAAFLLLKKLLDRQLVAPAKNLKETMEAYCQGELDRRAVCEGGHELADAARLFNSISEKNAGMQKEMSQLNLALEEKVKERTKQSDEANRAKSAFLANMSHELRTPLNAILGFTRIISKKPDISKDIMEQLSIILRSGEHLMLLINEILDLSKIEAGQMSLNEGPLDLLHLIQELKNLFCMKAAQKKLSIHFELAENLPKFVVADELKLKQVLINLIDNAIKFTDNGGIYFRAEERGPNEKEFPKNTKYIFFEVEDSGPGISFEEKKDLFKAFVQTRSGQKSKQGSGLGLAISHEFVHLMKGQFQVQSTPGKGSRFSFVIPLRVVSKNNDDLSELSKNHSKMEKPVPNSGETAVQAEPNLPEEPLRAIPLDVLDELADACRSCELGKVELGIEKVRKKNPKIAAQLSELAANYSFDVIADLVVRLRNTA